MPEISRTFYLGKPVKKPRQLEANEQTALFRWAELVSKTDKERYGVLSLLFAIPNGGKRDPKEAANLKRQGVKAGVPDICLPVSRGGHNALFIELKAGKNNPTPQQHRWLTSLEDYGNKAVVAYGWIEAKEIIEKYLS